MRDEDTDYPSLVVYKSCISRKPCQSEGVIPSPHHTQHLTKSPDNLKDWFAIAHKRIKTSPIPHLRLATSFFATMSSPSYSSGSSTSSTTSAHQARHQTLLSLAQSESKVTDADLAVPSSEPPQYQRPVQMARSGEKASFDEKEIDDDDDDDASSIISMKEFIKRAEKANVSRRQAVAMKFRHWSAEGKATWKRIEPYYRDFQYWLGAWEEISGCGLRSDGNWISSQGCIALFQ
ncbi:uncharacterized protein MYCFIDRAFT_178720 [Pseudocercospora fijiensis CIRAD86]|uniref:Uncharacterized protein n=1 Tax=Pseudocercospora fijiensis (strain CIRAD86) TaxID=383855 RepID=M2ZHI4_PSEFD|nr:uncharacterized protein MYCFIDRAFT_178720 [Pseudocercospora fijiensis CIRAD86]EME78599.1 hypothetical protein MYCFIDRAFT_178720 [Pseudocercospora fijiensis CIRAD86]